MKRTGMLILSLLVLASAGAQNEFATNAFYNQFKKIYDDAQNGFPNSKGDKRKAQFEELAAEYRVKLMLPLTDSAKLVIPTAGNPYIIYYFEADRSRLKIDQRAVDLREAVTIAFNKPLYAKTETTVVREKPLSNTSYYEHESMEGPVLFRQSIYYQSGKYYLSFEMKGKKL
jgi:hypothetical protein